MNYFSSDFKLGILGGGQLGKMLLTETRKFDIQSLVLEPSEEAPARYSCNGFYKGSLMDFDTVYQFGKMVDLLTIEIENVNLDALDKLEEEGLPIYPSPKTLRLIQNKGKQKDYYVSNNIPTSPHQRFVDLNDLRNALAKDEI
ncbi:MAG: 5-(carboxyamino)imidazole ribonucleotide synthase, partial [Flavobacterium sp.]|nr:5-(carboxyamino)imidazole ribonucleotide synthase [Flavobacterium sp.]